MQLARALQSSQPTEPGCLRPKSRRNHDVAQSQLLEWIVISKHHLVPQEMCTPLIAVDKSASHHRSRNEIGNDNPCSRHLSEVQSLVNAIIFHSIVFCASPIRVLTVARRHIIIKHAFNYIGV